MQATYQKARNQIRALRRIDREVSGLLTLQMTVIVLAIGMGAGVML